MPAFEIRHWQPHQVVKQAGHHLEADDSAELQRNERAQGGRRDIDEREQAEADCQCDEKPVIALAYGIVDGNLHVERADEDEELNDDRQHDRLAERAAEVGDAADQCRDADALHLALAFEFRRRRQLERDAGHMVGNLLEIERARPE